MSLRDLHGDFAWVVIAANAIVGSWALAAYRYPALRRRELWWATIVAEVVIFVEVFLGVALMSRDDIEAPEIHTFYGFSTIVIVGIIYSSRQQLTPAKRYLLYGFGGLFLMGTLLRTMTIA